jgi:hypothetical protein
MLVELVFVLTRPTYSSMSFGLLPAAWMRVGCAMIVGMSSSVEENGERSRIN